MSKAHTASAIKKPEVYKSVCLHSQQEQEKHAHQNTFFFIFLKHKLHIIFYFISCNWVSYNTYTAQQISLCCICIVYRYRFKTPPTAGLRLCIAVDEYCMNLSDLRMCIAVALPMTY